MRTALMQERTALVTGAGGGIGQAIVRGLAADGISVAAVDTNAEALELLGKTVAQDPGAGQVRGFVANVAAAAEVDALIEAVERDLGPIGYVVNAAGVLHPGPVASLSDQEWSRTFDVNATGVFHICRAVVRRMIPRRSGVIVTVASNAAKTPRWNMAAYAASKAAASAFTKCLGLELAGHGIRCNVVAAGSTDTPMLTSLWSDGDALRTSVEGSPETFRVGIPLGRLARPSDIADAVLFLLSDRASHITLHDLTVDGGAALGN